MMILMAMTNPITFGPFFLWSQSCLDASGLISGSDYDPPTITDDSVQVVFYGQGQGIKLYLDRATVQVRILKPG